MNLRFSKEVRDHGALREAYNALTEKTFGFSFEPWYRMGYWGDFHVPYTLFDGGRAVANVSVNRMEILFGGAVRPCFQLGTVMTDPAYRRRGLSRRLMEEVLQDCRGAPVFLFANESVLDFYPRFGFQKREQHRFYLCPEKALGLGKRLDMTAPRDREMLLDYYKRGNPFSRIQAVNGEGLLMFYCTGSMARCVRFLPDFDAVVIGEQEGETFCCFDVFCGEGYALPDLLAAAAAPGTRRACPAFTPRDAAPFETRLIPGEEDALFVLDSGGLFDWTPLLFPVISHT